MGNMLTLASTGHAAAASSSGGGGNYTLLIFFVLLIGVAYFAMIRPQRNRQRKVQEMQSQIGPGQRIRTTAGMYATVKQMEGDDVLLEVAPGVEMRFMRRAIMDVVPEENGVTPAPMTDGEDDHVSGAAADGVAAEADPVPSAPETEPAVKTPGSGAAQDGTVAG